MGLLDFFRPRGGYASPPDDEALVMPIVEAARRDILHLPEAELWASQPFLRTTVTFIARNIAQIGMHALERQPDGGRERIRSGAVADLLRRPSQHQTWYELIYDLVATLMLYDEAVLWYRSPPDGGDRELILLRPSWGIRWEDGDAFHRGTARFFIPGDSTEQVAYADELIPFHGWHPDSALEGSSPVEALRIILAEQWEASVFRFQLWKRGGRVGAYISRPENAKWSPDAKRKFTREFRAQYTGPNGGGVPVLEDGMEMKRIGFSAREEDFVEATKLSLTTVASVYHINPTMLGLLDNANYSNVREFRRMLYGDSLGPVLRQIEDRFNAFLLPKVGAGPNDYVEFNLQEKLRGSFEEQAAVYRAGVGAPWLTVNEARARENLPAIDGGGDLIRPLNVGISSDMPESELDDLDGQPS